LTTHKVFGPPGCGKTYFLLEQVMKRLEDGAQPLTIGYLAFTRKARQESKQRAMKTLGLKEDEAEDQLMYFRTLHSLAYKLLPKTNTRLLTTADLSKFGRRVNLSFQANLDEEQRIKTNDPVVNLLNLYRVKKTTLRHEYNQTKLKETWEHVDFIDRSYRQFKESLSLIDYTDLLTAFEAQMDFLLPKNFSLICVDEAQDLAPIQWAIVEKLKNHTKDLMVAGDDDQEIFSWAGASGKHFLEFESEDTLVLSQSYRVPRAVHKLAVSITDRIPSSQRQHKEYLPTPYEGSVSRINSLQETDFSSGEWLVLAQANYMLDAVAEELKSAGYLFSRNGNRSISYNLTTAITGWESVRKEGRQIPVSSAKIMYSYMSGNGGRIKRGFKKINLPDEELVTFEDLQTHHGLLANRDEIWSEALDHKKFTVDKTYITSILRKGHDSFHTKTPRIQLSTIHGAKGGECQNVVLYRDCTTASLQNSESSELNRVFYVGLTRPTENLYLVEPQDTNRSFII